MSRQKTVDGNKFFDAKVHHHDATGKLVKVTPYTRRVMGSSEIFIDNVTGIQYYGDGEPIPGAPRVISKARAAAARITVGNRSFADQAELDAYMSGLEARVKANAPGASTKPPTAPTPKGQRPPAPTPPKLPTGPAGPLPPGPEAATTSQESKPPEDPGNPEPALEDPQHPAAASGL